MIHVSHVSELPQNGRIYIFGAGEGGTTIKALYGNIPGAEIAGFIDNGKTGEIDGVRILSFDEFKNIHDRDDHVLLASVYLAEMAEQLRGAAIGRYYNVAPLVESTIMDQRTAEYLRDVGDAERMSVRVEYLYRHMQRMEELLRACAQRIGVDEPRQRTLAAFEYQWANVNQGPASHYDADFRRRAPSNVCSYTGLDPSWFPGRSVLDAGCGDGRFSHALCQLGAKVLSVDMSETGVRRAKENCAAFPEHRGKVANLLTLDLGETFDLIYSWGVTHHTGDTDRAIANLARHLNPGGYLVLMVYGYPRWEHFGDFHFDLRKERLMYAVRNLPLEQAEAVIKAECAENERQGWFDAVTPTVEDHYTPGQMDAMLRAVGLEDIVNLHIGSRHLFFRAKRPAA